MDFHRRIADPFETETKRSEADWLSVDCCDSVSDHLRRTPFEPGEIWIDRTLKSIGRCGWTRVVLGCGPGEVAGVQQLEDRSTPGPPNQAGSRWQNAAKLTGIWEGRKHRLSTRQRKLLSGRSNRFSFRAGSLSLGSCLCLVSLQHPP